MGERALRDIICPWCTEIRFTTNSNWPGPDAFVEGRMLSFKSPWDEWGWSKAFDDFDTLEAISCPECGGSLVDGEGHFAILGSAYQRRKPCPVCGRLIGGGGPMARHIETAHPDWEGNPGERAE